MEEHNRAFKGIWIPKEIWLHPQLNTIEKILWAEIDSLDNKEGCTASNKYLANIVGLSETRLTQLITKLKRMNLIKQESFDGRKRTLRSLMVANRADSLESISQPNETPLVSIYKEEKIEYNKDEAVGQADPADEKNIPDNSNTDKDNPSKYNTAKTNFSSVEEKPVRPPRKKVEKVNKKIYDAYKNLHPTVSKSLAEYIPGAIKKFEEYFKGEGEAKLIEALNIYSQDAWVKERQQEGKVYLFLPKNLMSVEKLEAKLLPLVIKPPKNEHLSETPQTEKELREAEEATARAFQKAFSADTE